MQTRPQHHSKFTFGNDLGKWEALSLENREKGGIRSVNEKAKKKHLL